MKCEKCGINILEGTLCDNCKNSVEMQIENPVVNEVPQAYDPVADLMNEPVSGEVNLEKSELENSIPLGDNNSIPEMPTNENVVSVAPQVVAEAPVVEETQVVSEEVVSEVPVTNEVPSQETNVQVQNNVVVEKKKMSTPLIIGIVAGAFVLLGGIAIFIQRYLTVLNFYEEANVNTFVTEVQMYMDAASTRFMTEAMRPGNQGKSFVFSNDSSVPEAINLEMEEDDKIYKINLDRNNKFISVIIYDDNFCYQIGDATDMIGGNFDKASILDSDVLGHNKFDNLTDGCYGKNN